MIVDEEEVLWIRNLCIREYKDNITELILEGKMRYRHLPDMIQRITRTLSKKEAEELSKKSDEKELGAIYFEVTCPHPNCQHRAWAGLGGKQLPIEAFIHCTECDTIFTPVLEGVGNPDEIYSLHKPAKTTPPIPPKKLIIKPLTANKTTEAIKAADRIRVARKPPLSRVAAIIYNALSLIIFFLSVCIIALILEECS